MGKYNDISSDILNKLPSGTPNGIGITAEKHRQVETSILDFAKSQWVIGDIKEVDCTNAYITANFIGGTGPTAGLGINDREGWAICNGKNLTVNLTGRVCVAYGTNPTGGASSFPTVGGTGGSKNAVVVQHNHTYTSPTGDTRVDSPPEDGGVCAHGKSERTTGGASGGVSGTDKNMQPYIVTLFIQKVS